MRHQRQPGRDGGDALRVLHAAEYVRGGVATYLREILPEQVAQHGEGRIGVALPDDYARDLGELPGVRVFTLPYQGRTPLSLARLARRFDRLVHEQRPGLLHLHSSFAGFAARLPPLSRPARAWRPRIVYCAHGWAFERECSALARRLFVLAERAAARVTDAIVNISSSEQAAAEQAGLPQSRCFVIRNGVREATPAAERVVPADAGRLNLLFVGRFDRQKGLDLLLEAMARIEGRPIVLWVAGEAVLGGLRLSWPPNAVRLGWLEPARLQAAMRDVDAVVMPSRWEGFGMVAIEAMRAGRAVIAARRGALAEIVVHGRTGVLFEPGDADALANLLVGLERSTLAAMGRAARKRFEAGYSAARMNAALQELYESLLAGESPELTRRRLARLASAEKERALAAVV